MGEVIRMVARGMSREDERGAPPTRRGEQRFRYPGPDAISEVSHRPEPRRQRPEPEPRREECRG